MAGVDNSYYCQHKEFVENLIRNTIDNYIIFKLPQVVGHGGNNNNMFNHFRTIAKENKELDVFQNIKRSLIDVDDVVRIVNNCIDKCNRSTINIVGIEELYVLDIAYRIIQKLNSYSTVNIINNHNVKNHTLSNSEIVDFSITDLKISRSNYTDTLIEKYIW